MNRGSEKEDVIFRLKNDEMSALVFFWHPNNSFDVEGFFEGTKIMQISYDRVLKAFFLIGRCQVGLPRVFSYTYEFVKGMGMVRAFNGLAYSVFSLTHAHSFMSMWIE